MDQYPPNQTSFFKCDNQYETEKVISMDQTHGPLLTYQLGNPHPATLYLGKNC